MSDEKRIEKIRKRLRCAVDDNWFDADMEFLLAALDEAKETIKAIRRSVTRIDDKRILAERKLDKARADNAKLREALKNNSKDNKLLWQLWLQENDKFDPAAAKCVYDRINRRVAEAVKKGE